MRLGACVMRESLPERICFSHCHIPKQFVTNPYAAEIPKKQLTGNLYPWQNDTSI
jgi:hypothetical protein